MREGIIRPLALCIIKHSGKLLVMTGYDPKKDQKFYRLLGGGIEFGEKGEEALRREFREELELELINIQYIQTLENIFTFNGKLGHEIVLLYEAELEDERIYEKESMPILDSKDNNLALWIELVDFKSGKEILYPDKILDHI